MLPLPENRNYTTRGFAKIRKAGTDSIGLVLKKLERVGYIVRNQFRDSKGKIKVVWKRKTSKSGGDLVAGLLGHAQPSTTLDIYSHAFDKNKRLAGQKLSEAVGL